jgi:hypothetical protein
LAERRARAFLEKALAAAQSKAAGDR